MRRTILCGLIGLFGLGCGGGSGTPSSAPPGPPPAAPNPGTPAPPPANTRDFSNAKKWSVEELTAAKPDLKATATEWRKLVEADKTKAGEQYAG